MPRPHSPAPLPIPPRIHRSPPSPVIPTPQTVQQPSQNQRHQQFLQPIRRNPQSGPSSGDEIVFVPGAQNTPLNCHYPEQIFVSNTLPTSTAKELHFYKEYCRNLYNNTNHQSLELKQLFSRIYEITNHPLLFQQLLWKAKIHIDETGVLETYCWIKK